MNVSDVTRAGSALIAGAALFAAVSAGAYAVPDTFNVSTTISASCSVTDSGPANLTPAYTPASDSGTGAETNLNTFCTGSVPTVTFTDGLDSGDNFFAMSDGGVLLYYQLSSNPTCNGTSADLPISEGAPQNLLQGNGSYEICAAVIAGSGLNVGIPAGTYSDTVTYTIAP
jgi:hypothetical protein